MYIQWLDELAENGHISKEAHQRIYGNCKVMLEKTAGIKNMSRALKGILSKPHSKMTGKEMMVTQGVGGVGAAAVGGSALALSSIMAKAHQSAQVMHAVDANRAAIVADPIFEKHQEKAKARFDEISNFAPVVAANLPLAQRLIKDKLHSGLSDGDVQRLAMIQGQSIKTAGLEKIGSILADEVILLDLLSGQEKVAGVKTKASKLLFKRDGALSKYLKTIGMITGIPFVVGGGAGVIRMGYEKHKENKLKDQLEKSYSSAMSEARKSSNPAVQSLGEDREGARKAFQALAHFAPHVAAQPDAAKAFMAKLVSYDQGIMTSDIRDLTEIERNISSSDSGAMAAFGKGFSASGDTLGLGRITSKGFESAAKPFIDEAVAGAV